MSSIANRLIREELKRLGLPEEAYQDADIRSLKLESMDALGDYNPLLDISRLHGVQVAYESKAVVFKAVLHEYLHRASRNIIAVSHINAEGKRKRGTHWAKTGYQTFGPQMAVRATSGPLKGSMEYIDGMFARANTPYLRSRFSGFNEGMIEDLAESIIARNQGMLVKEIPGTTAEEWSKTLQDNKTYKEERALIDSIAMTSASVSGRMEGSIRDELRRGVFTGNVMHLRQIDRTFGHGSVRILSALRTPLLGRSEGEYETILKYFNSDRSDRDGRQKLVEKITKKDGDQEDWIRYLLHSLHGNQAVPRVELPARIAAIENVIAEIESLRPSKIARVTRLKESALERLRVHVQLLRALDSHKR